MQTARGTLPVVVAAAIVPAAACGAPDGTGLSQAGHAGAGGVQTSAGGGSAGRDAAIGAGGSIFNVSSGGAGGLGPGQCGFTVEVPAEGVPAEPGQICSASMVPVDSNRAAQVRLLAPVAAVGDAGLSWGGQIDVAPAIASLLVGAPVVEVIDATDPALMKGTVSQITRTPQGYSFQAEWPWSTSFASDGLTRITVRVTLELSCPPATQIVHAVTDIHLCQDAGRQPEWVSSGSVCSVCRIIAEMAPSPIVPDKAGDDLPLARVLRLRIVELARISGTVVLLAENDGGDGLEYEWHVSGGRVERLAPDVIAWTLEPDVTAPFAQAAVWGGAAAAVATWAFNEDAA